MGRSWCPLVLPLSITACCDPPTPKLYSLDQVIAYTIQGVRKGLADGTAPVPNSDTGKPYPPAGLPICSLDETWTISDSRTKSTNAAVTASGQPIAPIGFSLAAANSSTKSAASTVVLTFNSPLCSSGGGGAAPAPHPAGGGGGVVYTYMFVVDPGHCPPDMDEVSAQRVIGGKVESGHICYNPGTTADMMHRSDYPPPQK